MIGFSTLGLFSAVLVAIVFNVSAAPPTRSPAGQMPASHHHVEIPSDKSAYERFLSADASPAPRKAGRLARRSNLQFMMKPKKTSNLDLAASLLDAANLLHSHTGVVYSSLIGLKRRGNPVAPEQLEDAIVFQLTEWHQHADLVPLLGDIAEQTESSEGSNDLGALQFILKSAILSLKETLLEVDSIINEMPSIRYIMGPMVYNIQSSIESIRDFSLEIKEKYQVHVDLPAHISDCFGLRSIKEFC